MPKELIKGNVAAVKAAILAGCRAFFGYPITPASEIAEAAAYYFPRTGGVFLQAESEVAAINMVYGASSTGVRVMTASSGPGISLMQEGISYLAGAELPCVIVDVMRGGPGLGNIAPEQSDYFQIVKGGGHGSYHNIVLAPNSAQDVADLTMQAFEIADRFRNPVVILTDGFIGQMMEPVEFSSEPLQSPAKGWAVQGNQATRNNVISSIYLAPEELEKHINHLEEKYAAVESLCRMQEQYLTDDAEVILIGYGIVARVLRSAVDRARALGIRVGLFRPVSLWPFPKPELQAACCAARAVIVCELSCGQMVEDVRLSLAEQVPVQFFGRKGGVVPTPDEVLEQVAGILSRCEGNMGPVAPDAVEKPGERQEHIAPEVRLPCEFR
ncbi:MAG: 3-methyl-2-oxobutanoate dehydrogenase subunit VorB [Acidobacteriota bacterium]